MVARTLNFAYILYESCNCKSLVCSSQHITTGFGFECEAEWEQCIDMSSHEVSWTGDHHPTLEMGSEMMEANLMILNRIRVHLPAALSFLAGILMGSLCRRGHSLHIALLTWTDMTGMEFNQHADMGGFTFFLLYQDLIPENFWKNAHNLFILFCDSGAWWLVSACLWTAK